MTNIEKIRYEPEINVILGFERKFNLKDRNFKVNENGHVIKLNLGSGWKTVKMGAIPKEIETLTYLRELSFAYNRIEKIENLEKLIDLRKLDLSNNRIKKIEGLDNFLQLEELNLWNNRITHIEGLENLDGLIILKLLGNPLVGEEKFLLNRGIENIIEYCKNTKSKAAYEQRSQDVLVRRLEKGARGKLDSAHKREVDKERKIEVGEDFKEKLDNFYEEKIEEDHKEELEEDYKEKIEEDHKKKLGEEYKRKEEEQKPSIALKTYENLINNIKILSNNALNARIERDFAKASNICNESITKLIKAKVNLDMNPSMIQKINEKIKELNLNIQNIEVEKLYYEGEMLEKNGDSLEKAKKYENAITSFNMALKKYLKGIILSETYGLVDLANKLYSSYSNAGEKISTCHDQLIILLDKI